jgi:hypothetical protein
MMLIRCEYFKSRLIPVRDSKRIAASKEGKSVLTLYIYIAALGYGSPAPFWRIKDYIYICPTDLKSNSNKPNIL